MGNGQIAAGLRDVKMTVGSTYISAPYVYEHGVRFERGSQTEPLISLQFRVAFVPDLGKRLNDKRDDTMFRICDVIAHTVLWACERGLLRMPSLDEVKIAYKLLFS